MHIFQPHNHPAIQKKVAPETATFFATGPDNLRGQKTSTTHINTDETCYP